MALNLIDLVLDYVTSDLGNISRGQATIVPTTQLSAVSNHRSITTGGVNVGFNQNLPVLSVVATDSPGVTPSGWGYTISFSAVPGSPAGFSFFLPAGPVNYTSSAGTFTWTATASVTTLYNGMGIEFAGSAPSGFAMGVQYYLVNLSGQTFQLSSVIDGAAIAASGTPSGTFLITQVNLSTVTPGTIAPAISQYAVAPTGTNAANSVVTGTGNGQQTAFNPIGSMAVPITGGDVLGPLRTQIPNVVFDGDSLTIGAGVQPFNIFPRGGDYPSQVVSQLDPRGSYYNVGVGGEQIITMIANAPTVVDTKLVAGRNNVVVICGGSNDIWVSDINPYSRIVTYCQARKAAGWKVIVGTITPRADTQDSIPADFETVRLACNASIRADFASGPPAYADALADWGADSLIGTNQVSALNAAYYTGDGAHHNWRGYAIRAKYALNALSTLGVIGQYREQVSPGVYDAWLPAKNFELLTGAPVYGAFPSSIDNAWKMPHASDTSVAADFLPPVDWVQYGVSAVYARTGSATGTVALQNAYQTQLNIYSMDLANMPDVARGGQVPPGGHLVAPVYLGQSFLGGSTPPPAGKAKSSPLFSQLGNNGNTPRCAQKVIIKRTGTDATYDTCTDDIYLFGVYVWRNI